MQIVLKFCSYCKTIKEFWLTSTQEASFYCRCGVNRLMRNYYGAEYLDYFSGKIRDPINVEGLVELAAKEHMVIDPNFLRKKLQKYDLDNLTEAEFFHLVADVIRCDDVLRFRRELMQFSDAEPMLQAIAQRNPRIDIPGLRSFLRIWKFPLREWQVIVMEAVIVGVYYHREIEVWNDR